MDFDDEMIMAFLKEAADVYNNFRGVYVMNPDALEIVKRASDFVNKLVVKYHGKAAPLNLAPQEFCARFSVTLPYLDLVFYDLEEFVNVMNDASLFAIEPVEDTTFEIEFNIPNLWIATPFEE